MFLIWSNEHNAWWRPEGFGYITTLAEAGIYNGDEALRILISSAHGSPPGQPKEVIIPYPMSSNLPDPAVGAALDGVVLTYHLELNRDEKGDPITHVDPRPGTHGSR